MSVINLRKIFTNLQFMKIKFNTILKKIVRQIKVLHPSINEFKYDLQFFFRALFFLLNIC